MAQTFNIKFNKLKCVLFAILYRFASTKNLKNVIKYDYSKFQIIGF